MRRALDLAGILRPAGEKPAAALLLALDLGAVLGGEQSEIATGLQAGSTAATGSPTSPTASPVTAAQRARAGTVEDANAGTMIERYARDWRRLSPVVTSYSEGHQ